MKQNILLDRFRHEVVPGFFKQLNKKNKVVKIISYNGSKPKGVYKSSILFDDFLISNGTYFQNIPWVLESKDLKFFHKFEGIMIHLLSRYTVSPKYWSVTEIATHGLKLLNFWKYNLKKNKIDICFSYYTPHDPSSFSLYLVSKYLKIPYIWIDSSHIGLSTRHFSCSLENRNLLIQNKFSKTPIWIKDKLLIEQKKIAKNFRSSQPLFFKMEATKNNYEKIKYYLNRIKFKIDKHGFNSPAEIFKSIFNNFFQKTPIFFKFNRYSWHKPKAFINRIYFLFEKISIFFRLRKLKKYYSSQTSNFVLKKELNFIYFASPLSPEGSFLPSATWNRHEKTALFSIIQALPKDWKVIYKINPGQFDMKKPYSTFIDWFNVNYYDDLLATNKIIFAPINYPSDELMKKSRGVASINGTSSYEAIFLNKNSLIFSTIWYEGLDGVFLCKSKADVSNAINKMLKNKIPKPKIEDNFLLNDTIFEYKNYVVNSFSNKDIELISKKFLLAEKIFQKLGPEKWNF